MKWNSLTVKQSYCIHKQFDFYKNAALDICCCSCLVHLQFTFLTKAQGGLQNSKCRINKTFTIIQQALRTAATSPSMKSSVLQILWYFTIVGVFVTYSGKSSYLVGSTTENTCEWATSDLTHLQDGTFRRPCSMSKAVEAEHIGKLIISNGIWYRKLLMQDNFEKWFIIVLQCTVTSAIPG